MFADPEGRAAHGLLPARPEEGDAAVGVGVLLLPPPGAQPSPAPIAALGARVAVG